MAIDQLPSVLQTNSWDLTPRKDEIVEEIHSRRALYAAQFDYDLGRLFKDLQAKESLNPAPRAHLQPLEPTAPAPKLSHP